MKRRFNTGVVTSAGLVTATAVGIAIGRHNWNTSTAKAIKWLDAGSVSPGANVFDPDQVKSLPLPVMRYFQYALTPGQALIQSVSLKQAGEIRLGSFDSPWHPFTATHHVSTNPPGFLWDASVQLMPLTRIRVQDSYVQGVGAGRVGIGAPLLTESGRRELNCGELQRFLAEAPWYPTALLPGQFVAWEALDGHAARATLAYLGLKVSMDFYFDEQGAIIRSYTPGRYRKVKNAYIMTPWEGHYGRYERTGPMMVPGEGAVAWILPEGRLPVWRSQIVGIHYDYAD